MPLCVRCRSPAQRGSKRFCSDQCRSVVCVSEWRRRIKDRAVAYKGGQCTHCGYSGCPASMTFHHPEDNKSFGISQGGVTRSWGRLKAELDKCVLLCLNCHAEEHWNSEPLYPLEVLTPEEVEERQARPPKPEVLIERTCPVCPNPLPRRRKAKFCSVRCSRKVQQRVSRPGKEELYALVWRKPTSQVAKDLGVSDTAVSKWCKSYGIKKPPRGYWAKQAAKKTK